MGDETILTTEALVLSNESPRTSLISVKLTGPNLKMLRRRGLHDDRSKEKLCLNFHGEALYANSYPRLWL